MRRPFLVAAGLCLSAILIYAYARNLQFAACLAVIAFGIYFIKKTGVPKFYIIVCLIFPMILIRVSAYSEGLRYQGTLETSSYAWVQGIVSSAQMKTNSYCVIMYDAVIEPDGWGEPVKSGIMFYCNESVCSAGDEIRAYVKISDIDEPVNEGQMDMRLYYVSMGINYSGKLSSVEYVDTDADSLIATVQRFSDRVSQVYEEVYSERNAGLMESIVLGDKSELDKEVSRLYQKNGISHILAISGLHVTMVGMLLYKALKRKLGAAPSACAACVIMLMYLCMTGNSISATRAVIMLVVFVLADVLGRTSNAANTLGLAAVIVLFSNPYYIFNIGFQMSFLAIAGMIFIKPVFSNERYILLFLERPKEKDIGLLPVLALRTLDGVITGACVSLATLPVVLTMSGQFPLSSVLLNIVVIPLMSVLMVSGIMTGIIGMFSMELACFTGAASGYILDFYEFICEFFSKYKLSVIVTGCPSARRILFYTAVLLVWGGVYFLRLEEMIFKRKTIEAVIAVIFVVSVAGLKYEREDSLKVAMLDVGQGDAVVLQTKDGLNALFDGGSTSEKNIGQYRIYSYLKHTGVRRLDYIFVSHQDADHISGIYELIELCDNTFEIGVLVLPKVDCTGEDTDELVNLAQTAENAGIKVGYAVRGDEVTAGETTIRCVHPCADYDYESANDYSAVYLVTRGDFSMLMTGDAESKAEKCLIEDSMQSETEDEAGEGDLTRDALENIDVLKVGHHGSKGASTEAFLETLKPQYAIISCGKDNSYGHPHNETIERLERCGAEWFCTSEAGEIIVTAGDKGLKVWGISDTINVAMKRRLMP